MSELPETRIGSLFVVLGDLLEASEQVDLPSLAERHRVTLAEAERCLEAAQALAGRGDSPHPPPTIGAVLQDNYELLSELGRGGMGLVFGARDRRNGREVALKVIAGHHLRGEGVQARFKREAATLTRLKHPAIVPVLDTGEHEGQPFLVMEWVPGESLEKHLRDGRSFSPREAAHLVERLAIAIEYAHGQGVLHRDLKPSNVLWSGEGEPRLIDFGLALELADEQRRLTRTGAGLGTLGFSPPEQLWGRKEQIGPASDVYALGATLYALACGQPDGAGSFTTLEFPPEVGAGLRAICFKSLQPRPERRYASAAALAADLQSYLAGRRPSAQGRIHRAGELLVRSGWWGLGAIAVAVALLGLAWSWGDRPPLEKPSRATVGSAAPVPLPTQENSPPAPTSALGQLAAEMRPGEFRRLETNVAGGESLIDLFGPGEGGMNSVLNHATNGHWNPTTHQVYFFGTSSGGTDSRFVIYDEPSNTWSRGPTFGEPAGLAYDRRAFDPQGQRLFVGLEGRDHLQIYQVGAGWRRSSTSPSRIASNSSYEYFPELGGVVLFKAEWGTLYLYHPEEDRWELLENDFNPSQLDGSYNSQTAYLPRHGLLIFGGGNYKGSPEGHATLWKLDGQRVRSRIADAPRPVRVPVGIKGRGALLVADPASGHLILLHSDATVHAYDPDSDSWYQAEASIPEPLRVDPQGATSGMFTSPVPSQRVIMFVRQSGRSDARGVYLYKHAAPSGQ